MWPIKYLEPTNLRYRLATYEDLPACRAILHPGFKARTRVAEQLLDIWKALLASGTAHFAVFEDSELPHPESIQGFGVTAFLNNDFVQEFFKDPRPYISSEIYELTLDKRSPLLEPREVRLANSSSGLDLMSLHFTHRNWDFADPRTQEVVAAANSAFFFFHSGYRINSLVQEVYGRDQAYFLERSGFRLHSDFATYFTGNAASAPLPSNHPYLLRLSKDHIQPSAVSPLSFFFHPLPPRIYFSLAEQKVLERALLGESDEEMSKSLGVAPDTVKKTWRRVYERVDWEIPQLLRPDASGGSRSSRGSEKRRHLLEYLRSHLEELRPAIRPKPSH